MERDRGDRVAGELERDMDVVAAERIQPFGLVPRVLETAVVARLAVVIEDHFLVQRFRIGRHPKTFCTLRMPATSASTSASVL